MKIVNNFTIRGNINIGWE